MNAAIVPRPWLTALLIVWVLLLNQLSTQAMAETLHRHELSQPCLQDQLLHQLNTLLPGGEFAVPTLALRSVACAAPARSSRPAPAPQPRNRDPPMRLD
ncbi:hypothetical protein [uncultured Ferrimonas sp.]|uniref:hypothetical protein n=1 Tax=uncultured Ferrimonas sp. TaxID=432640 RepID=UPI0026355F01|nr:hypothetical protein [uncultured Ferrimonas sp.]